MLSLSCLVVAFLAGPPAHAQEDAAAKIAAAEDTAAAQLDELLAEYSEAVQAFRTAYRAKSEEERPAFLEERPNPELYALRFQALAEEHPHTEAAAGAYSWIVGNSQNDETVTAALDELFTDHLDSESLAGVCRQMERRFDDGQKYLAIALEESDDDAVRGASCYSMGKLLMNKADMAVRLEKATDAERTAYVDWLGAEVVESITAVSVDELNEEAAKLFQRVVEEYADVEHWRGSLGQAADRDLFQLQRLGLGMPAPDIVGEDIDGVAFKLSDYKGKVVVIDFWGNW